MKYCDICGEQACSQKARRWFCQMHAPKGQAKKLTKGKKWTDELVTSLQEELKTAFRQLESAKSQTEATVSAVFSAMEQQLISLHSRILQQLRSLDAAIPNGSIKPRLLCALVMPNTVEVAKAIVKTVQFAAEEDIGEYLSRCQESTWRQAQSEKLCEFASQILQEKDDIPDLEAALEYCLQAEALGFQAEFARGLVATAERRMNKGLEYADKELGQFTATRQADINIALQIHSLKSQQKLHPEAKSLNSAREIEAIQLELDYFPSLSAAQRQFQITANKEFGESLRDHSGFDIEKLSVARAYYYCHFPESAARLGLYTRMHSLGVPGAFDSRMSLCAEEFAYTSAGMAALWAQGEVYRVANDQAGSLECCLNAERQCYPYTPYLTIVRQLQNRLIQLCNDYLHDKSQALSHLSTLLLTYPASDSHTRSLLLDKMSSELKLLGRYQEAESCECILLRRLKSTRNPITSPTVRKLRRLIN
jgi:hypothetical protein